MAFLQSRSVFVAELVLFVPDDLVCGSSIRSLNECKGKYVQCVTAILICIYECLF
jgi:hypothetical protein